MKSYYFKVIIAMYFKTPAKEDGITIDSSHVVLLLLTSLFTIALGLVPSFVIEIFG